MNIRYHVVSQLASLAGTSLDGTLSQAYRRAFRSLYSAGMTLAEFESLVLELVGL